MKLDLSTAMAEGPTEMLMMPVTTLETKKAPPRILLRPTSPSLEPVKEIMLEKTSEAPFPSERRATPAMVGESFRVLERLSREGQK